MYMLFLIASFMAVFTAGFTYVTGHEIVALGFIGIACWLAIIARAMQAETLNEHLRHIAASTTNSKTSRSEP